LLHTLGEKLGAAGQTPAPALAPDELSQVLRDCVAVTQRLQRTHDSLEGEIVRLRRELESKDRELERRRRLASLGELAAGVAHEVRNPLGAIQLYSGLLRSEFAQMDSALQLIEKIETGIRAIDGVVQDALALAPRSESFAVCSMRGVLDGARDVCRQTLRDRRVRLRIALDDESVHVMGEPGALQRIFVNLIANAAEAAPPRSTVTVRSGAPQDGLLTLRVEDEGPGFPEGLLDRIFDPFVTTKEHGTGLGLTIVHRLVEAHGGQIHARNRAGCGAEFTIALPAAAGPGRQGDERGGAGRERAGPQRRQRDEPGRTSAA
jgi:signal transduction histidine kinase